MQPPKASWVRLTVNADELEHLLQRLHAELAHARRDPAPMLRAHRQGRLARMITVAATAVGILFAMVPFVAAHPAPPPPPRAPPAPAMSMSTAYEPPVIVEPAPTLVRASSRGGLRGDPGHVRDGYVSQP